MVIWTSNPTSKRAVCINKNEDGHVWAVLYVGVTVPAEPSCCPHSVHAGRWTGSTVKGAMKWAAKMNAVPTA